MTLLTYGHELVSCGNDFLACGNELVSCGNKYLTCGNDLLSCGNDLLTCGNDFLTCGNDLLSCGNKIKNERKTVLCPFLGSVDTIYCNTSKLNIFNLHTQYHLKLLKLSFFSAITLFNYNGVI